MMARGRMSQIKPRWKRQSWTVQRKSTWHTRYHPALSEQPFSINSCSTYNNTINSSPPLSPTITTQSQSKLIQPLFHTQYSTDHFPKHVSSTPLPTITPTNQAKQPIYKPQFTIPPLPSKISRRKTQRRQKRRHTKIIKQYNTLYKRELNNRRNKIQDSYGFTAHPNLTQTKNFNNAINTLSKHYHSNNQLN
jgi:hypothetical protein